MNLAKFAFNKSLIVWMMLVIFLIGGIFAYFNLSRFEDPEFTIKEAVVTTAYPGAIPKEVENEVTDKIESAIQQMTQLKELNSTSMFGKSEITVQIKDKYTSKDLPQIWDELRRKVNDIQKQLPPGAGPSIVNDDYSDVYGIFMALTGDGYSFHELNEYGKTIRRQLLLVPGVAKVMLSAKQPENIFIDISHVKLAQLGLSPQSIYDALHHQNMLVDAGNVRVGDDNIIISPTGSINTVDHIKNLLLRSTKSGKLIRLGDIAKVSRGYQEIPSDLMYFNGKPAMGIGISVLSGGNMVKVGEAVDAKIKTLNKLTPVGIELHSVYDQPSIVKASVNGFLINLLQALGIVIVVLLLFMGFRSGIIIGAILLLTVMATLLCMYIFNISLQRISLGALVIALGMLVDNAIVVVEGVLMASKQGISVKESAIDIAKKLTWPLLGATIIGVLAFSGIAMSPDSTGEYTRSLFYVVFISLMFSWLLALTAAPLFCNGLLQVSLNQSNSTTGYNNAFFKLYGGFLKFCIKIRWVTILLMICLLIASVYGFRYVKQSFFPNSTTPIFYVNFWRSEGTDIRATDKDIQTIQNHLLTMDHVKAVTSTVGKGAQRFMLIYTPEKPNSSYAQLIVRTDTDKEIPSVINSARAYLSTHFPNAEPTFKRVRLGPSTGEDIEVRFSGPNANVLRKLSYEAQAIMHNNMNATDIRSDWRQPVKIIKPIYAELQAQNTGISQADLSEALATTFAGLPIGLYRESDELIPILARAPDKDRLNVENIQNLQIWSPTLGRQVPINQVVSSFKTTWADARLKRLDRILTITVSSNPKSGLPSVLFNQLKSKIEAISIPAGYKMEWGGEYENSKDAQAGLATYLPLSFLAMFIVLVVLFNALKQPLVIFLTLPLAIIGVTVGLLITNSAFDFMALLGFLSLMGMIIKNAIVLIDQIDLEIKDGKDRFQAIIDSCISRVRPVSLAAITTILGLIPLLFDAFFKNMSVTIMFGLAFATALTLVVIPVLYAIFFNIHETK